jgi:glutathione S-transferase
LALVAAKVDFADVRIEAGDPADALEYKQNWFQVKDKMHVDMPFPNLPYFMDDKVSYLPQSDTILRYIGRTYKLMGDQGQEHRVDLALDELKDLESGFTSRAYPSGREAVVSWFEEIIVPTKLPQWKAFLGTKKYLTGDCISVADLKLYTFICKLEQIQKDLKPNAGEEWLPANLQAWKKRIEDRPEIKAYLESPNYQVRPMNNPHAKYK